MMDTVHEKVTFCEPATRFERVNWLFARACFAPTVAYGVVMSKVFSKYHWWDRVDEHIILGALPFKSTVPEMAAEGVRGVVNCCEEYSGPVQAYEQAGIRQLRIPTIDFTPPKAEDIMRSIEFINEFAARNESVYIHCKAGRARSATVALCWLVTQRGMTPAQAQAHLIKSRPNVYKWVFKRAVVNNICERQLQPKAG